jgi:hypothetical protein
MYFLVDLVIIHGNGVHITISKNAITTRGFITRSNFCVRKGISFRESVFSLSEEESSATGWKNKNKVQKNQKKGTD